MFSVMRLGFQKKRWKAAMPTPNSTSTLNRSITGRKRS